MLTIKHVAQTLHVSPDTVRRIVSRGELTAYRIGGQLRFTAKDVDRYLTDSKMKDTNNAIIHD